MVYIAAHVFYRCTGAVGLHPFVTPTCIYSDDLETSGRISLALASDDFGAPLPGPSHLGFDAMHPSRSKVNRNVLVPGDEAGAMLNRCDLAYRNGWQTRSIQL